MLEKGFKLDVEEIMERVNSVAGKTQNLMFSATIPSWVSSIARKYLRNMEKIDLIKENEVKTSETISHLALMVKEDDRHSSVR